MIDLLLGLKVGSSVTQLLIVLKVTIVLLIAHTALLVMRRTSPSTRHLVVGLALFASLALPVLAWTLPAWKVVPPLIATFPLPISVEDRSAQGDTGAAETTHRSLEPLNETQIERTRVPTTGPAGGIRPWPVSLSLVLAWSSVAAGLIALLLAQVLTTTWRIRRALPITNEEWLSLLTDTRRRIGVRSPVGLRRGATRAMPLVWGFVKPTVLLPQDCDDWPLERRRAVLAHELGHVARRDILVALMGHLACAIHWFNPLAWSLKRRLSLERELACDRLVIEHGVPSACYANHLLETAKSYRRGASLSPVMAARSQLEGRIMAILEADPQRTPSRALGLFLTTLAALAIIPLASLAFASPTPAAGGGDAARSASASSSPNSDTAGFKEELRRLGLGTDDLGPLIDGLSSESAATRAACAWALGRSADPNVVGPLVEALRDSDATVRQWAVRSLGKLGDPRVIQPLLDQLDDDDPAVREWVVRTLGSAGDERAVQPLVDRLDDDEPEVREWIVRTLASVGDQRAVQPLIDRLDDDDPEVREWIVRTLAAIGDDRVVQPLVDRLDDDEPEVREWIVRTLASVGDQRAVQPLIDRLDDDDPEVREWIVRTLAAIGDDRVVQPLIDRLDDDEPEVREWIVRTLASVGDDRVIQPLIERLDDQDAEVREWAARGLGSYGSTSIGQDWRNRAPEPLMPGLDHGPPMPGDAQAIAALIRTLESDDAEVREWAARGLGKMGDGSAVGPLSELLGDQDEEVRQWAIRSLGSLRDTDATDSLIDALEDSQPQVREWAVRSLGLLQDERALRPLAARLVDDDAAVRQWTVRALGVLGDPRAVEPLRQLRDDEDAEVRRWTERALEELTR